MADVFEARDDLQPVRERLWSLIEGTPWLDWLLLTKRPENILPTIRWSSQSTPNVWLGTTVENQTSARQRIPALLRVPAQVHFLSCEPLLGSLDLGAWLPSIDWVIAGGESGGKARQMNVRWLRDLRDQCVEFGVPFHFKQWGNWSPADGGSMIRMSKHAAGRELDGRTWDQYPVSVRRDR